jgi:hypothetical protein
MMLLGLSQKYNEKEAKDISSVAAVAKDEEETTTNQVF